ncbi:uncharacterized protein SPSK_03426 [Sporothrix schenckii 1099-18]|uniref:RRM domain-containing protein n=1 Tax=Sporothrix schenckii 1099-18 TaxID=1397361 RepID=A0A0F2M0P3_SPOSC|nr:uncharacterized protein SPSK_03426 [Sporothrix schenckii 1099-18]KJR82330.1 hypothetical protein SPSK_03426 [Sporothrix schenckii 1099-18]
MAKVATEFEKIINTGAVRPGMPFSSQRHRSRKKNTALAAKIFGKDRRASAPVKAGGALAVRAGVQKRVSSTSVPRAGNINTEWTHDLHEGGGNGNTRKSNGNAKNGASATTGSLASRVSRPGEAPKGGKGKLANNKSGSGRGNGGAGTVQLAASTARGREARRSDRIANALNRADLQHQSGTATNAGGGLSIRGIAAAVNEPLVVMAQNFAPGTTAADIESAMTPVGGLVSSCRILKTTPLVIAEIVFESREGAERVIETFNNQTADGRILHVYPKAVNHNVLTPHNNNTPTSTPAALSRHKSSGQVVDGSLGFDDPMDTDGFAASRNNNNNNINNGNLSGRLYSDDLVGSRPPNGSSKPRPNKHGRPGRR